MDTNDISNITNAGNTLISTLEKFFPYWGLEGKAVDIYINEIANSDKPKEVKIFEILNAKQSIRKVKNAKSILEIAATYLKKDTISKASYSENEEWYDRFWENAGNVSDKEAQIVWGKILAKEIEKKGSTPKGIFRILSDIDPSTAKAFVKLCEHNLVFAYFDESDKLLSINKELIICNSDEFYIKKGLSLAVLNELEAIGLISCSFGLQRKITNVCKILFSDGKTTECIMTDDNDQLSFGTVMLTKAGRYLNNISSTEIAEDHIAIVKEYFMKHGYSLDENNKLEIRINNDSFEIIKLR